MTTRHPSPSRLVQLGLVAALLLGVPAAAPAQVTANLRSSGAPVAGYLNLSNTKGAAAVLSTTTTTAGGTRINWTATAGGAALAWISPPLAAAYSFNAAATCNVWARESANAVNSTVRCEIGRYTTTEAAAHCTGSLATEVNLTMAARNWTCTNTTTSYAAGDRVVVRIFAANAPTLTMGAGNQTGNYDAPAAATGDSYVTLPGTPSFRTTTVADGSNPSAVTIPPGGPATNVDAFTLATNNGTDTVSALTVTFAAGTAQALSLVEITDNAGTALASASNPVDTVTFTFGTPLNVTTTATPYFVRITPKSYAAMPASSAYAVTATVTDLVSGNSYFEGLTDTASATVTVDHAAPGPVSGLGATPGDGQATVTWTADPTDADFTSGGEVVVLAKPGVAPTETPADGTDYAGGEPIGAAGAFVACVAAPGARTCTATGLTNGNAYYFIAYARDSRLNYSGASNAVGPVTPVSSNTIQLVPGANVTGAVVCPDQKDVYADQFGFTVAGVADRVNALTVSGLGTTTPIASIKVADDTGAVIASATPTGDAQSFTFTAPNLAAPIGTTNYRIYFDVKSHTALAAGNSIVTPTVTSYGSTNTPITGSDSANSFTINNTAQANVPSATAGGATETSLTVTYGASTGAAQYVVFARRGGTPTGPTDGTPYTAGSPDLANTWVAYAGPSTAPPAITGLASSSTYSFAVYARDACLNYSTVAASATGTTSAPAQAITVGNGTGVVAASVAPGSTAWTPVDSFSVQITSGPSSSILQSVTYKSLAGMSQYLAGVRLVRGSDSTVLSTVTAPSGDVWTFTGLNETLSTTAAQYRLEFQPKGHAAMPSTSGNLVLAPGAAGAGVVTAIGTSTGATVTYADGNAPDPATGQVVVDNLAPADPTAVAASGGAGDAHLSWANPGDLDFQKVVVLAKQGSPFLATERPADGDDPALTAPYGAATVVYVGRSSPQAIGGLAAGTWYFKIFSRDTSGNFSAGVETSATVSSFIPDGDATKGSVKPVVSIVNPMRGAVVAVPFRLQARIFSPKTTGGVSQPINPVTLLVDEVDSGLTMSPLAAYGTTTESGVWGTTVTTLATGSHTLRVTATNAAGTVYSGTVTVSVVAANTGDGNLVVRDNASQLCSDCHAMKTHSSEATGTALGSWAVTCRECHTPHDTTNLGLVRTKIKPPELAGPTTEKDVVFTNKSGYVAGSFASPSNNGPCQVCHTQTDYYRSTGAGPGGAHETGDCSTCHVHNKGLAASCTMCHGDETRLSTNGADPRQTAAPPVVVTSATAVSVPGGGAHVAHVNKIPSWRTNPLPCAACHPAPHATKGQTDLLWSTLATGNGAILDANMNPPAGTLGSAWPTTPSCTNWCHGGGMPAGGGSHTSPAWTEGATAAQCGTCHASPPPLGGGTGRDHPQNTACALCHGPGYAQASIDPTAKGTHIDGTIQKPLNGCTACHGKLAGPAPAVAAGSTNPQAAPGYDALSVDTQGNTYSSTVPPPVGVGAHGKHVNDGMMSAKTCNVCHPLPGDGDTSHANGSVQMAWSAPATSGGVTPGYTRPSCTNYCHSAGDPMGAAVPAPAPISWTSAGPLGCASCHASSAIATNAHGKHVSKYTCNECHVGTTQNGSSIVVGGGTHVNGSNDVSFDASSVYVQGGSYTPPTSPTNPATCSNIYCHSNGTKRAPPYTSGPSIAWNGGATNCTSCHGGPVGSASQIATGKHNNHVNVSAVIGGAASTNMTCGTCHASTVTAGQNAPVTGTAHVDRVASVTIDPTYGATATFTQGATEGTGSCASNYCHSSGQDPAAAPAIIQYLTPAWNDAALGCDGCHGRAGGTGNGTGAPNYANGGTGTPSANSHTAHVSSAADCEHCHAGTVTSAGTAILATSTLHLNKARDVQILAAYDTNGASSNYTQGTKTCNSVSCHGSGTPTWGGPKLKCSDCHGGAADSDSFAFGTVGVVSTSEWTSVGHGQSTFGANTFPTLAAGTPCLYCHDDGVLHDQTGNPFRLRGATGASGVVTAGNYSAATATSANQVCLNCHAVTGSNGVDLPDGGALGTNPLLTSTKKVDAYHAGSKHSAAANGGTRCWDCHDPHGDGTNIKMVGSKLVKASTDNHSWAATRVTGVTFTANATGTDYAGAATKLCNACHTSTLYYPASGGNQTHQSGAKCVACHVHQQASGAAFAQSTACNACHNSPPTVGNHAKHIQAIQAAPVYGSTTIGSTGTTYGYQCGVCHTTVAANHVNGTGGTVTAYNVDVAFSIGAVTTYAQGATATNETGPTGLLFKSTNGTCGTVYCHDPLGAGYTGTNVNWTQAPGSLGCTACHPMGGANTTALTNRHDRHINLSTGAPAGYAYTCERCHSTTTTTGNTITNTAQHAVGTHNVAFNSNPVNQTGGTYTIGSNGACGSTYCHSNGQSATAPFGAPNVALNWNAASGTATCSSCHGGYTGTVIASGKHAPHANNPSVLGTSYYCADCHATTVTGTATPAVNYAGGKHVNGTKDVSIANRGTMASSDTGPSCSNTYCHSDGQRGAANARWAVTWSDLAWTGSVCVKCHGTEGGSIAGEPRYANGGVNTATSNSHAAHVKAGTDCATCHNGIVNASATAITSTLHTNGTIDVAFDQTLAGATASHTDGTYTAPSTYVSATCSSVKCHGTNSTPVSWGTTLDCSGCHMGPTGTTDAEVDDYNYNNGTFAKLDPEDWINNGHGRPSGNYDSGNVAAGFDTAIGVSSDDGCKYCHDKTVLHGQFGTSANPFRLANIGAGNTAALKNGVCTVCHGGAGYLGKTATKAIDADHHGSKHTTTNGGELCWDCHDPHGDSRYTGNATETPVVAANEVLGYMIDAKLVRSHPTAEGNTTEWGTNGTTGPTYATNAPRFNKALGGSTTAYDWPDYALSTLNGVCQVCHTGTAHFLSTSWNTAVNGDSTHNNTPAPGPKCTSCHTHDQPPSDAFKASCTGCHGNKGTARTPVAGADTMLEYAPPTARDGTTSATTANGVGAHLSHVNQLTLRSAALSCSDCHGASLPAAGHPSAGQAPINWGALATTGGITTATYTQGTGCSATYCHGNFKNGNYQLATAAIPAAPTGLAFSDVGGKSLTLSWTKVAGAWTYKIERGTGTSPTDWAQIGTTSGTSYADGGLAANTTYSYRVTAWVPNGSGSTSAPASKATLAVSAPSTVTYDLAPQTATSVGADGNTNIVTQTSYTWTTTVYRGLGVANYARNTTTQGRLYRNGTLTANSTYTGVLYSPVLTNTNPVAANLPLSIDWVNRTTVTGGIGWFEVSLFEYNDTTGDVGAAKGTWTSANIPQTTATTTTFNTLTGTFNNLEFYIASGNRLKVVFAYKTGATAPGDLCFLFGATRVASATAGLSRGYTTITPTFGIAAEVVPSAPSALQVTGFGANQVSLSWTAGANATSYKVERAPESTPGSGTAGTFTQVGKPATTSFTDGALASNTLYFYRVTAFSTAGSAALATVVSQRTGAPADGKPAWTGTFTSTTTLTCGSCHGDPPGGTHPSATNCSLCHPGYGDWAASNQVIDKAQHLNGTVNVTDDCTVCHATSVGPRRDVVTEFGMKWSHKRSFTGTPKVNPWDCIVCHMEGDPTTGKPTAAHMDGKINLRDPDTGNEILNVTFTGALGGTAAGSFGPGTGSPTITAFSRDLGVAFENDPNFLNIAAIQVNQCMKCHDADGALAFNATKPLAPMASQPAGTTRTAAIPFGTAISYSAVPTAEGGSTTAPTGTQTAGGVAGGVIRLDTSFATGNSSYHPVLGRNNNSYVYGTRAVAPYASGITGRTAASGSTNNYGYLISCWDCHAPDGTGNVPLTGTVTAHGGPTTVRGKPYVTTAPSASNQVTLCKRCHALYENSTDNTAHGTGSAIASSVNSPMGSTYMNYGCNMCHGSGYTVAVRRPIRAEDTHGTNTLSSLGTLNALSGRWLADPRPFAFVRNRAALGDHQPLAIGATTYASAQCSMTGTGGENSICSGQGLKTYTPGGKF